jgi:tetrathionate reductase subunit A
MEGAKKGEILTDANKAVHVIDKADGMLKNAANVLEADIFYEGNVTLEGATYTVKSSFVLLKESAFEHSLDFYAKESGVDEKNHCRTCT